MRGSFDERLVEGFRQELDYLRRAGADFARRYPKIASRLELSEGESSDPQIERLLESFAFLTARIHNRLDADFPEIPKALLDALYPYLSEGIPPLAIARFDVGRDPLPPPEGRVIPRGMPLYAQGAGATCRFRTTSELNLAPIQLTDVRLEPVSLHEVFSSGRIAAVIRIRLKGLGVPLNEIKLDRLRLYLGGNRKLGPELHELLVSAVGAIAWEIPGGSGSLRPFARVSEVGFAPNEAALPERDNALSGYRLLAEYFAFQEKFLFVDIEKLGPLPASGEADLLIGLSRPPAGRFDLDDDSVLLNCVPIVNLFVKTAEPIRLTHTTSEYLVRPELNAESQYEIHSITDVLLSAASQPEPTRVAPYFGFGHAAVGDDAVFWHARRVAARAGMPGTELHIGFKEQRFRARRPPGETVTVRTMCTNRALTEQLPTNAVLQADVELPANVSLQMRPTTCVHPPADGATLWRLVSQLSLSHIPYESGKEGLAALQEVLRLYCPPHRVAALEEISGLRSLRTEPVVRRIGMESWRGFCRGVRLELEVDERAFVGGSAHLLGAVLSRFFAQTASINSFTELALRSAQREGIWQQWPATIGSRSTI